MEESKEVEDSNPERTKLMNILEEITLKFANLIESDISSIRSLLETNTAESKERISQIFQPQISKKMSQTEEEVYTKNGFDKQQFTEINKKYLDDEEIEKRTRLLGDIYLNAWMGKSTEMVFQLNPKMTPEITLQLYSRIRLSTLLHLHTSVQSFLTSTLSEESKVQEIMKTMQNMGSYEVEQISKICKLSDIHKNDQDEYWTLILRALFMHRTASEEFEKKYQNIDKLFGDVYDQIRAGAKLESIQENIHILQITDEEVKEIWNKLEEEVKVNGESANQ